MRFFLLTVLSLGLIACQQKSDTLKANPSQVAFEACFTPGGNCQQVLTDHINAAQKSVWVQAYGFTSYPIARALVNAKARGLDVRVIFDQSNFDKQHFSFAGMLRQGGVPVWEDNSVNIAHNKVMIFDDTTVETGSFNYTKAAQNYNAENMLIITNSNLARVYRENFMRRLEASVAK